ncbi:MAG: hypothetical protein OEZ24_02870 [Candidatus Bathyarchaeota archaeon]|nr:hypothetical protein [Candidatus Bathyarchaeota archaeon]
MNLEVNRIFAMVSFIGFLLAVLGFASGYFLQTTAMQVNFAGDSSTCYLHAGRTYRLAGIPYYSAGIGGCKGTVCLYFDSEEILRRIVDFEDLGTEDRATLVVFESFQVDRSGLYALTSIEPQVGEIAIQETPIQPLLGIDDTIFIFVGFAFMGIGVILLLINQRRMSKDVTLSDVTKGNKSDI